MTFLLVKQKMFYYLAKNLKIFFSSYFNTFNSNFNMLNKFIEKDYLYFERETSQCVRMTLSRTNNVYFAFLINIFVSECHKNFCPRMLYTIATLVVNWCAEGQKSCVNAVIIFILRRIPPLVCWAPLQPTTTPALAADILLADMVAIWPACLLAAFAKLVLN